MNTGKRHRFPPEIISREAWLYYWFNPSHRDIEILLAEPGVIVSDETIRLWCIKCWLKYSRGLKQKHQGDGETFFIDKVFVKINGKQHYLWRAVDQDGDAVDVDLQARRDENAAKRFFKRKLRIDGGKPRKNRNWQTAKLWRCPKGGCPRGHSWYFSVCQQVQVHRQAQRFLSTHAPVSDLFNLGRHLVEAKRYGNIRIAAFDACSGAVS